MTHTLLYWMPGLSSKSIVAILAFAGGAVLLGAGTGDPIAIAQVSFMVAGWVSSIIGVAAVMRRDVKALQKQMDEGVKWRESHDLIHSQTSEILGRLTALSQTVDGRVHRLESNEDDRYKRRSTNRGR